MVLARADYGPDTGEGRHVVKKSLERTSEVVLGLSYTRRETRAQCGTEVADSFAECPCRHGMSVGQRKQKAGDRTRKPRGPSLSRHVDESPASTTIMPAAVASLCPPQGKREVVTNSIRLVVTVKSYPQPSSRYHESVCVAGIRTDTKTPEWVRLYPLQFRDLPEEKQFQ